ncbi:hypothetical protein [Nocardioides donggukensis]|uniref:AbiEi antitoxin C-terminal domain-containing protein n=1 Tax=Nocardioides donggukensis TaxID=2774019 RepID=A0A927K2B7_9ACTN|nr:hypothetical protein [Nocardioides donggukensis]MBD8868143.1 hypothetical protein [Nocardioides donggukensis]
MGETRGAGWRAQAARQHGVLGRRQLRDLGVSRATIRAQVSAGRWAWRTGSVLTTTTGPLSWGQRLWVAVLHCGPGSAVGGLSAAAVHGLRGWDRPRVTVLVPGPLSFAPVEGLHVVRTRRPIGTALAPGRLPVWQVEPAVLLFAGYEPSRRTGLAAVAAVVQQRLSTPERLRETLATMHPLRRARDLRALLADLADLPDLAGRGEAAPLALGVPRTGARRAG